jgi:hypothetical protein
MYRRLPGGMQLYCAILTAPHTINVESVLVLLNLTFSLAALSLSNDFDPLRCRRGRRRYGEPLRIASPARLSIHGQLCAGWKPAVQRAAARMVAVQLEHQGQYRFLRVQAIFGLVEDD